MVQVSKETEVFKPVVDLVKHPGRLPAKKVPPVEPA